MKKLLCLFAVLFLTVCALAAPLKKSEIRAEHVYSKILGEDISVNVYLPAGYDQDAEQLYPVVYLLHGLYGGFRDWAEKGHMKDPVDEMIASGEAVRMIIITPNAGHPDVHHRWNGYFNMPGRPYEDFFFKELIPTIESRFRIQGDKQHRVIMGLSMGGGGSTVYCQRHPDMFSSCYAMSAWLDNSEPDASNPADKLYIVRQSVRDHSAINYVIDADEETLASLRTVKWFFDCGDDDSLLDHTIQLYQEMRNRKVKAELRVRDGWHSWEYWHTALRWAIPFASRNFGETEN